MTAPTSAYEQWVVGLQAWSDDGLADLSGLPQLDGASLPAAAYQRLMNHVYDAIDKFMIRWNDQMLSAVRSASSPHQLARCLVDARPGLAQRLQLARHQGLPAEIRTRLVEEATAEVESLQSQLEASCARSAHSGASSNRENGNTMLRILRDNALTAVLNPQFTSAQVDDVEVRRADNIAASSKVGGAPQPFTTVRKQRRIFLGD